MNIKIKNVAHRYDRPKPRYSKYKKCLNMILLICIKQDLITTEAQLSNNWSSSQAALTMGWKKALLVKKSVSQQLLRAACETSECKYPWFMMRQTGLLKHRRSKICVIKEV